MFQMACGFSRLKNSCTHTHLDPTLAYTFTRGHTTEHPLKQKFCHKYPPFSHNEMDHDLSWVKMALYSSRKELPGTCTEADVRFRSGN